MPVAIDLARIDHTPRPESREPAREGRPKGKAGSSPLAVFARIQIGGSRKVKLADLVLFTQQLGLLLNAGTGLVPAIGALALQMKPCMMKEILMQVHARLEGGSRLSECLEQYPLVFDTLFVSIIRAGEASGALRESLDQLAGILEMRRRLYGRIREAMTYPAILTCIMGIVIVFMMTYMFPRFSELFADLGDELPWTTRMLMGSATLLRSRWWAVIPIAIMAVVGVQKLWKMEALRRLKDWLKLGLPFVGALYTEAYLFQLFSSLGLLLGSRVPHLEAIGIARKAVGNVLYQGFFASLAEHVEAGRGVAQAFQESRLFPQTVKLMIATAEGTGALDTVMTRLSQHYREELESHIRRLSTLIEPIMLVIMGVMVGFIAISFIVPIFKLSRAVH